MKSFKWFTKKGGFALAALVLSMGLIACSKDDDCNDNMNLGSQSRGESITTGTLKGAAVGDIVLNDNGTLSLVKASAITDEQKAKAEAVVFYVGEENSALGKRTLAVNVKNSGSKKYSWAPSGTTGYTTNFTDIQCWLAPAKPESGAYYECSDGDTTYYIVGDIDGSDNWKKIQAADPTGTAEAATNYPAFNYVNTAIGENYYIPSIAELVELFKSIDTVHASIEAAGGTRLDGMSYWSSSQVYFFDSFIYAIWTPENKPLDYLLKNAFPVVGIRAFANE